MKPEKTRHDIVVIGASMGGVEALPNLLRELPQKVKAAIFVVLHIPGESRSYLPEILNRQVKLLALHPKDGQKIQHGCIYVAPPDHHLLVMDRQIRILHGPKENRHRPSIDPLFRSAARHYTTRVIGIILTGTLDDGTAGLAAVQKCGGITVVQHPEDAVAPGMPLSALRHVTVDYCKPLPQIRSLLPSLIGEAAFPKPPATCDPSTIELISPTTETMQAKLGPPAGFVCPDCNGPIWEALDGGVTQFRCLVGHVFSPESFLDGESESLERSLWVAVKTLEERATLMRRLSDRMPDIPRFSNENSFSIKARESEEHARVIRGILRKLKKPQASPSRRKPKPRTPRKKS